MPMPMPMPMPIPNSPLSGLQHPKTSQPLSHLPTLFPPLFPPPFAPLLSLLPRLPSPPLTPLLLNLLPPYPGTLLLVTALNLTLAPQISAEVANSLGGRRLRIQVTAPRWQFDFSWTKNHFVALHPSPRATAADLTIGASLVDFMRLAQRQEDADTLFFNRRLTMQGDTELGLLLKNTLDALSTSGPPASNSRC